jgi:glycosyltransferase involved in cell wall biosynthesis
MRILHVTHQYPPAIGGAERYIADISEELGVRGHRVDVFTCQSRDSATWRSELPGYECRHGVNVYRFRSLARHGIMWRSLHYGMRHYWPQRQRRWEPFIFFGGGPHCPRMVWQMFRKMEQYDVVHLNCLVYAHVVYGYMAARLWRVPVVLTPHAHVAQPVSYDVGYERQVLMGSDYVLTDTLAEKEFLVGQGVVADRVGLGGLGLPPAQYPLGDRQSARRQLGVPERAFVVLFLGRKDRYKGLGVALEAFSQLAPQRPALFFLAVGQETDDSRALWVKHQGQPNILNLGPVSDEQKILALHACDCLILPSIAEAFGIVFLEAWIMGKPVIGAATMAGKAVINDGTDGLVASPEDAGDFARCMARLADDPARAREMGECGRAKVMARYTIPQIVDRVEKVYTDLSRTRVRVP